MLKRRKPTNPDDEAFWEGIGSQYRVHVAEACRAGRQIAETLKESRAASSREVSALVETLITTMADLARKAQVAEEYLSTRTHKELVTEIDRLKRHLPSQRHGPACDQLAQALAAREEELKNRDALRETQDQIVARMEHINGILARQQSELALMQVRDQESNQAADRVLEELNALVEVAEYLKGSAQ